MKYESIKGLEDEKFCRLTGVKRTTFKKMLAILSEADTKDLFGNPYSANSML